MKIMDKMLPAPLWLIILTGMVGAQSLDYQTYKDTVEPIFLKKRPTHARCVVFHASANHPFRLEPLNKGATTWTETQSRKNFKTVSNLVKPGEPLSSLLLIQPLAHSAGGAEFHSGGRQFASQDDPDWRAIAAWVKPRTKEVSPCHFFSALHQLQFALLLSMFGCPPPKRSFHPHSPRKLAC